MEKKIRLKKKTGINLSSQNVSPELIKKKKQVVLHEYELYAFITFIISLKFMCKIWAKILI